MNYKLNKYMNIISHIYRVFQNWDLIHIGGMKGVKGNKKFILFCNFCNN